MKLFLMTIFVLKVIPCLTNSIFKLINLFRDENNHRIHSTNKFYSSITRHIWLNFMAEYSGFFGFTTFFRISNFFSARAPLVRF
jgi:hypothetical protein